MTSPLPAARYQSRREVIDQMAPRYHEASLAQKGLLLDTVVARTGYARKYAIRLLNQPSEGQHVIQRRRLPRYGSEVQQALVKAWKAASREMLPCRTIGSMSKGQALLMLPEISS